MVLCKNAKNACKRYLAILLVMVMALTMLPSLSFATNAAQSNDLSGHWAQETLTKWAQKDWLKGDGNGTYRPNESITRAEFMVLVNRMKGYTNESAQVSNYSDVSPSAWYYQAVSVALAAGYVSGTSANEMSPEQTITRQEAMTMIARMSGVDTKNVDEAVLSQVKDEQNIDSWARKTVAATINEGLVSGSEGNMNPTTNISRAESIVMMDRVYTNERTYAFKGTYGPTSGTKTASSIHILASGVTLSNMIVSGDLTVAESVGEGEVALNNVTVTKNMNVYGGGIHTILFNNVNVKGALVIDKKDGKVRILATGKSNVTVTYLESGAVLVSQEGSIFGPITIEAGVLNGQQIVLEGNFDSVTNKNANANIAATGTIKNLILSENAKIEGKVIITNVTNNSSTQSTLNNTKITTTTPPSNNDDSSGGGGGSGGGDTTVKVTGVTLNQATASLTVSQTLQLAATVSPSNATNKAVTWASSSSAVATVSETGLVTAVSVGTANITATTADGSYKATCAITVTSSALNITLSNLSNNTVVSGSATAITLSPVTSYDGSNLNFKTTVNATENLEAIDLSLVEEDKAFKNAIPHNGIWTGFQITLKDDLGNNITDIDVTETVVNPTGTFYTTEAAVGVDLTDGVFNYFFEPTQLGQTTEIAHTRKLVFAKDGFATTTLFVDYIPKDTPILTGVGNITGNLEAGETLTAGAVTYSIAPLTAATLSYQWLRSDSEAGSFEEISGATNDTYLLTIADGGKYVKVKVVASGTAFGSALSNAAGPVAKAFDLQAFKDALKTELLNSNESLSSITTDLLLKTALTGFEGVTIVWSSSDASVINPLTGAVTRHNTDDKPVVLTATIAKGTMVETLSFDVIVRNKSLTDVEVQDGYIDPNFVEGYPNAYIKNGTIWVNYKLKADAEVYMIVNNMNGHTDADVKAVLDGRAGRNDSITQVDRWPYFQSTANTFNEFDTGVRITGNREEVKVSFVVKKAGYVSPQITTIVFESVVVDALDTTSPRITEVFKNSDGTKLYLVYSENLLTTSVPLATDFSFSGNDSGITVTNVSVLNRTEEKMSRPYPGTVILTLSGSVTNGALSYSGSAIKDNSVNQNPALSFTNRNFVVAKPTIQSVTLGADRKHILAEITPNMLTGTTEFEEALSIMSPSGKASINNVDYSFNPSFITLIVTLEEPIDEITRFTLNATGMRTWTEETFADVVFENAVTVSPPLSTPTAAYSASSKEITLTFAEGTKLSDSGYGGQYTITADGISVTLRGFITSNNNNDNKVRIKLGGNSETHFNNMVQSATNVTIGYTRPTREQHDMLKDNSGTPFESFSGVVVVK